MSYEHLAKARESARQFKAKLRLLPSCDLPSNSTSGRIKLCLWGCGKTTRNISEIGDTCWRNREAIRRARKAIAEKRPMSDRQRAALNGARSRKSLKQALNPTPLEAAKGQGATTP